MRQTVEALKNKPEPAVGFASSNFKTVSQDRLDAPEIETGEGQQEVVVFDGSVFVPHDSLGETAESYLEANWRLIMHAARTEDVAQDAALAIWRNWHRYNPDKGSRSNWAYAVARRKYLDEIRTDARKSNTLNRFRDSLNGSAEATIDIGQSVMQREEIEGVWSMLTPSERKTCLMRASGMSYAQVAQELGIPEGTLKSKISHMRRRLGNQK